LAHQGHGFSQEVLAEAGRQLGNLAVAALRNLGLVEKKGRVGVSGGVFAAGQWVLPFMQEQIWQVAPNQTLTLPDFDPAAGAVLMAARHFQLDMERVAAGLRRSL
jgi:N-acetylglucosamine kinase-like BadF-type ATPase